MDKRAVITGAFSFTGAAAAQEMLRRGWKVHTLTNRKPPEWAGAISSSPLQFDPDYLRKTLEGTDVFINTYWVRLPWKGVSFQTAIDNTKTLVEAARAAKVRRFVHVSVSNASKGRNLGYYRGKWELEKWVEGSGLSYAIICPTLILGPNDVLTNNITWFLRRFPIFPVPQGGNYRLQPVTLADTARIIADAVENGKNLKVDAAGPDTLTFKDYLRFLAVSCRAKPRFVDTPNWAALAGLRLVEPWVKDIILTREELLGLQQELLFSSEPPLGKESALGWLAQNAPSLGNTYANDIQRHFGSGATQPVMTSEKG